jgi:hypothetical protein
LNEFGINNIVKENDDWQRNFIEMLLKIKDGYLIAENKNIRYFSLNKGTFYIYEDDYKFEVCLVNIKKVKIDKFFKGSNAEIMKTVTKEKMIEFLEKIKTITEYEKQIELMMNCENCNGNSSLTCSGCKNYSNWHIKIEV